VATAAERLSSRVTDFLNGTSLRVWDPAQSHPLIMNRASLKVGKSTVCSDELSLDQDGSGVVDDGADVGVWEREGVAGAFAVPPHLLEVRASGCHFHSLAAGLGMPGVHPEHFTSPRVSLSLFQWAAVGCVTWRGGRRCRRRIWRRRGSRTRSAPWWARVRRCSNSHSAPLSTHMPPSCDLLTRPPRGSRRMWGA
jgi:hypothetical protein